MRLNIFSPLLLYKSKKSEKNNKKNK